MVSPEAIHKNVEATMASISSFSNNLPIQFNSKSNSVAQPAASSNAGPADGVTLSSGASSANAANQPPAPPAPGPGNQPQPPAMKDWTVMVYVASDTNLYDYQMNNLTDA